ncbi:MAG: CpaE family protein [Caulobacterales bacterium]|nr:CpaE family protein [Caulobacterales bacterium]
MRPGASQSENFDVDFDAEDEFAAPPATGWASGPDAVDPFADFPPAQPEPATASFMADDFAELGDEVGYNPVADLIAGAQAALDPVPDDFADSTVLASAPTQQAYTPNYSGPSGEVGVPRITIHVFSDQPSTATLFEQTAQDRRMSRASLLLREGGLTAAVEFYQNQPTPSLIIVETLDSASLLLDQLDRLAEVCDPGTKVMVIGSANDIALYRELMRRGVSEYIAPPLHGPLQIINAVSGLYADPAAPFIGRQIAVVGAKGGVGSSTLAHNLAYSISERIQAGTVIVDLDLPFGTAGLDFNQDPLQGVADALGQPDRLDQVLMDRMMVRCTDRLSLFAAPANLDQDYDIAPDAYEEVSQKIRGAAPYVVLDLPHAWSGWKRRLLLSSDDVVVVATPDLASLRNAKNIIDLVRQARPNDQPPRLVINMAGVPQRPELPIKDFGEALGLTPSLVLPFDPKLFGQAANNGQMLSEVGPKSKAAEGIDHFAQLISRRDPPPAPKTSLLAGLFKKK